MDLSVEFDEHPSFEKEFKKFSKKYPNGSSAFRHLRTLLSIHFLPKNKNNPQFTLKVLHRVEGIGTNVVVYKIIMATKGLKHGQSPRICFWLRGLYITFLCFGTHIDNYKDSELRELAKRRIRELDPTVILS